MAFTQQAPIGTPDVNLITKTLAGLQPDSRLQEYAMLHKNNPYIVSLAKSESDRRKALRAAAQGQNAGQMPTVVDQDIASMAPPRMVAQLPEDQGIARLSTPNIQGMADGGIAGYGDDANEDPGLAMGGSMFDFAQRSEPVLRMAGGGEVKRYAGKTESLVRTTNGGKTWFLDVPDTIRDPSVPYYREIPNPLAKLGQMEFGSKDEALQAYIASTTQYQSSPEMQPYTPSLGSMPPTVNNRFTDTEGKGWRRKATGPAEEFNLEKKERSRTEQLPTFAGTNTEVKPRWTPELGALATPSTASGAPTETSNTPPAPPPAPVTQQGLGAIPIPRTLTAEQAKAQAGQFADFGDARTALKQAEADQETYGARMRTTLSEGLPKTPALQGLEKLLDKQDAETGGEKDKAAGLALLMGGLAIAGGSSQFALQNLKEAVPAVAQYGDALKDIKKMERENMKMRGEIEQARRAEERDNTKLKLELEDKIAGRKDKLNEMGINLLAKIADTDTRTATELWKTSQENASRIQSAVASAQAHTMGQLNYLEKLGAASPESALRKGYDLTQQDRLMFRARETYEKMAADANPSLSGKYATKGEEFRAKYPTLDVYMASMPSVGGTGQIYSDNNVNPNAVRSR